MHCLFCKIVAGEIPAKAVYTHDEVMAFADIHPQAPVHILIVPKKHVSSLSACSPSDESMLGKLLLAARDIAATQNIAEDGYRITINNGKNGGQTVGHLHVHLLGGRSLHWPPG